MSDGTIVTITVVKGVEGPSVYVNDYRVAGPKPWGGGKTLHTFTTTPVALLKAVPALAAIEKERDHFKEALERRGETIYGQEGT